jgi:hypothetical protein
MYVTRRMEAPLKQEQEPLLGANKRLIGNET